MYVSCDVAGLRKWCAPAKRKMEHEMHTVEQIAKAVDLVIQETRSLRYAANEARIPFNSLCRYIQKRQ